MTIHSTWHVMLLNLILFYFVYSDCKYLQCGRPGFDPQLGKIPWRWKWPPTPVFLPGKSHGQRSLVGYSSWGHEESDMTEQLTLSHYWTYFFYFLAVLGLCCCVGFSLVVVHGPLTVVASLVVEHRL